MMTIDLAPFGGDPVLKEGEKERERGGGRKPRKARGCLEAAKFAGVSQFPPSSSHGQKEVSPSIPFIILLKPKARESGGWVGS